jgi:hypothetical protein
LFYQGLDFGQEGGDLSSHRLLARSSLLIAANELKDHTCQRLLIGFAILELCERTAYRLGQRQSERDAEDFSVEAPNRPTCFE